MLPGVEFSEPVIVEEEYVQPGNLVYVSRFEADSALLQICIFKRVSVSIARIKGRQGR